MIYLNQNLPANFQYCTSGKFICSEGGAIHPKRVLPTFVLLFGSEGEYKISQNGVNYSLIPGTYMLLFPNFEHAGTEPCLPGLSHYWCHFYDHGEYKLIGEDEKEDHLISFFEMANTGGEANDTCIKKPNELILPEFGTVPSSEKYRMLLHQLIDSSRSINIYHNEICDLIITQILYELSDSFIKSQINKNHSTQHILTTNVIEYIRINATSITSVADVARSFGYNSEYLTTLLKKTTSKSLIDHINESKIEAAKKLLLCTMLTISELAPKCGFTDPKYFSRLFHRITDMTPGEYRRAYYKMHYNK